MAELHIRDSQNLNTLADWFEKNSQTDSDHIVVDLRRIANAIEDRVADSLPELPDWKVF